MKTTANSYYGFSQIVDSPWAQDHLKRLYHALSNLLIRRAVFTFSSRARSGCTDADDIT